MTNSSVKDRFVEVTALQISEQSDGSFVIDRNKR